MPVVAVRKPTCRCRKSPAVCRDRPRALCAVSTTLGLSRAFRSLGARGKAMKLKDETGRLRWDCDGCGSRLMVGDGTVVGLHGSDIRLLHAWCAAADGYF